jgi:hypothetical protein
MLLFYCLSVFKMFTLPYLILFPQFHFLLCSKLSIVRLFMYFFCGAYIICGLYLPCSWLTDIWKFYTQMYSYTQVTVKCNISENATNNRLYQITSNDARFNFTSSALACLIIPAVLVVSCRPFEYLCHLHPKCIGLLKYLNYK